MEPVLNSESSFFFTKTQVVKVKIDQKNNSASLREIRSHRQSYFLINGPDDIKATG